MPRKRRSVNKNDLSKNRRRRKKSKLLFFVAALILVIVGTVILACLSELRIKEIKISGTSRTSSEKIEEVAKEKITGNYWGILPKSNFMIYPKSAMMKAILDSTPSILSVGVGTELDRNLYIEVKERLAEALWCDGLSACYFLDSEGIIFARSSNVTDRLMRYYGIVEGNPLQRSKTERYGEEGFFPELENFTKQISDLGLRVISVEVIGKERAEAYFKDNSYLIFLPYEKDKKNLFENIELFINDLKSKNNGLIPEFEYIDARYGNKIFYKLKSTV